MTSMRFTVLRQDYLSIPATSANAECPVPDLRTLQMWLQTRMADKQLLPLALMRLKQPMTRQ